MKTILFAVSSRHKKFFEQIKKHTQSDVKIVYTKRFLLPCLKSLLFVNKIDLSAPIELRIKDFVARERLKLPYTLVKLYYTLMAYFTYMLYFPLIKKEFDQIMLWNGMTFRQAIALQIAKLYNIKPVYIENGVMPNRIVVDRKGVNFNNSVPRDKEFFKNYINKNPLPTELVPRNPKNAKKFEAIEKLPLFNNYIFIPFQLDYDTQVMLFSPWIKNMRILFDVIEKIAISTKTCFVFKEHPTSIKDYPDLHKRTKENRYLMFANGYPTQELIEKSKGVITINSTVGIESLLLGKNVITLGDAFYNIDDIVYHCETAEELATALVQLDTKTRDELLIGNFLKYLYYDYLIEGNFKDFKCDYKKIETILSL